MKFFIDTANIDEIKEADSMGMVDGVTTNPSLIAKEGRDFDENINMTVRDTWLLNSHIWKPYLPPGEHYF